MPYVLMLDSLPRPVVFAHRGASAHAPENTLSAFQLALEQGADAIELDVQLTADNKVVVFHDFHLNRITNGKGLIKAHTLSEIQQLNAGKAYGPAFSEEKIPTLKKVFQVFGKDSFYNIELKNSNSPFDPLPDFTAEIINQYNLQDQVLISSFNPFALYRMEKTLPGLDAGFLFHGSVYMVFLPLFSFLSRRIRSLHIPFSSISIRNVKAIHRQKKLAFCYTINHPNDIHYALTVGIDGFFTDDPALARRTLSTIID